MEKFVRFNILQYHSIIENVKKKNDTILLKVKIHRFQVMDGILTVQRYISVIIYGGEKKKKKKKRKNARLRWCMQIRPTCKENYDIPDTSDISRKMSKLYSISWYTRGMNKYFSMDILFINLFLIILFVVFNAVNFDSLFNGKNGWWTNHKSFAIRKILKVKM